MSRSTNDAGQYYLWGMEGYDFTSYVTLERLLFSAEAFARLVGKVEENRELNICTDIQEENEDLQDELNDLIKAGKVYGSAVMASNVFLWAVNNAPRYNGFVANEDQSKRMEESRKKSVSIVNEAVKKLRTDYAGRTDAEGKQLNKYANQLADYAENFTKIFDPKEGNLIEAEFHAPYITHLNNAGNMAPKFDTLGLETVVNGLNQKDVPNGVPIYDDYMTITTTGPLETAIQYERQRGEAEGWNAEKEADYLKKLRATHAKFIEAYDRIFELAARLEEDTKKAEETTETKEDEARTKEKARKTMKVKPPIPPRPRIE